MGLNSGREQLHIATTDRILLPVRLGFNSDRVIGRCGNLMRQVAARMGLNRGRKQPHNAAADGILPPARMGLNSGREQPQTTAAGFNFAAQDSQTGYLK
jgi:hypothetical protein